MAEPKSNSSNSSSDEDVKAPNIIERAQEEIEAFIHKEIRDDIDENTPLDVVEAPNVFERVQTINQKKESQTNDDERDHSDKEQSTHDKPENGVRVPNLIERSKEEVPNFIERAKVEVPNLIERAKEEVPIFIERAKGEVTEIAKDSIGSILHHEKSSFHHKETHGKNDNIDDETTPLNEVKAPNVFERAKEELEAIVGTIHPKMGSNDSGSSPKEEEGGFRYCLAMGLEKVCRPWGSKKD